MPLSSDGTGSSGPGDPRDPADPGDRAAPGASPERDLGLLPGWSSLVILLTLFSAVSLVTLISILRSGEGIHVTPESGGRTAYGPADFPELEFAAPLLPSVEEAKENATAGTFRVPPAPFSMEGIFPCSECHADMEVNRERREMDMFHEEIVLDHGPDERWCFDCHNGDDRDHLRLVNGELVGFEESYRLCGQCHGTIYRDWRVGIHGRRRGYWNGAKSYLLCAHCHNPHAPGLPAP